MMFYARLMGTTWVLQTETKGTGATMVPLERATKRAPAREPVLPPRKPQPPKRDEPAAPAPRAPRRFRVVDVMTGQPLVEDVDARDAIDALGEIDSIVDVIVYVWQEERERWRMLTFSEQHAMWELAAPAHG